MPSFLVDSTDWLIAWIGEGPARKNGVRCLTNFQCCSIDVNEISPGSFGFFFLLIIIGRSSSHQERCILAFGVFGIAIDDSNDFFVENSIVDVCFFGVEVFVKGCPHHTVVINGDAEPFQQLVQIGAIPISLPTYFLSPPSDVNTSRLPPFSTYLFKVSISSSVNLSLGDARTKSEAFLTLSN